MTATAHDRWCDGYGASHTPTAIRQDDGTYAPACSAGCELDTIGTAGSEATARSMAASADLLLDSRVKRPRARAPFERATVHTGPRMEGQQRC